MSRYQGETVLGCIAVRQSPTFWPLTRKFLKLWEYFCDSVAHSLGCAPADRKVGDNLVKGNAGGLPSKLSSQVKQPRGGLFPHRNHNCHLLVAYGRAIV